MLNLASLNQRVNALTSKVNTLSGATNLAGVLTAGNSAGTNDIDMANNDILNVDNIDVTTINGSAYPPVVASDTLQQVLTAGNTANNTIELTDGTQSNLLQKTNINIIDPATNGSFNTTANDITLSTSDPLSRTSVQSFTTNLSTSNISLVHQDNLTTIQGSIGMGINVASNSIPVIQLDKFDPVASLNQTLLIDLNNIIHTQTTAGNDFNISSNQNLVISADNIDLSSAGRLIVPSLASADYLDYNAGTLNLKSDNVGYTTDRLLLLENTNATAGNTTGVPVIEMYKSGRNGALNDVVSSIQFNAKDGLGVKRTFGKIESTITTNIAPANYDGALDFYSLINGVNNLVFRLNGADNENNSFRPLDLNGNDLKTSTGDMLITTTASTGTGNMLLNSKGTLGLTSVANSIQLNSNTTIQAQKTLALSKSAGIVSTQLLNGESLVNTDFTNNTTTTLDTNALTFLNGGAGTSTIYNNNGFQDITNNSIACNTSLGFRLLNGVNVSQLNQGSLYIYNQTGTFTDNILLQNTGGGNPVFNLNTYDSNIDTFSQAGASATSFGLTNVVTGFPTKSLSMNNPSGSAGNITYINQVNSDNLIIQSTNTGVQIDTAIDLVLNGANIISGSATGFSGNHLRILLNGTYYKIKLEND